MTAKTLSQLLNELCAQTGYQDWSNTPARRRSGELDFGCHWRLNGQAFPTWRVSWIEETGELYALEELAGIELEDRFIVIGRFPDEDAVELAMNGWADCFDLAAIIAQAQGGTKLPPPAPMPVSRSASGPAMRGLNVKALDDVVCDADLDSTASKIYRGQRPADDEIGDCRVVVIEAGRARPLPHVKRHSPDGFEWGYGGSGPADLALSLLADYFGERPRKFDGNAYEQYRCLALYQSFKARFIAAAPREGFAITSDQIAEWLSAEERNGEEPGADSLT